MNTIDEIISMIQAYKEDHPHLTITDDMIKDLIEENIDKIIEEIKEEI